MEGMTRSDGKENSSFERTWSHGTRSARPRRTRQSLQTGGRTAKKKYVVPNIGYISILSVGCSLSALMRDRVTHWILPVI